MTESERDDEPESPERGDEPDPPRLIKRYANRKLYDTVERLFTSLSRIRVLVRDGVDVVVLDHSTGQDRTAETLSQALSHRRGFDDGVPDLGVLSELIRAPERLAAAITHDERDAAEISTLRNQVQALSLTLGQLLRDSRHLETRAAQRRRRTPSRRPHGESSYRGEPSSPETTAVPRAGTDGGTDDGGTDGGIGECVDGGRTAATSGFTYSSTSRR
jgi:PHB/PHA accumulation regulator DNA-binding domain